MNLNIISFAIEAHDKVNHKYDGKPYSLHLYLVAYYCQKYIDIIPEQCQQRVLEAAWLHDTIEDCRLTYNDILKIAGQEVADIVYALSNEKGRTREERANDKYYEGIKNTPWATYVKLCDRLANVAYSKSTKSRMFEVYKKENENFLNKILPSKHTENQKNIYIYKDLVNELNNLLK